MIGVILGNVNIILDNIDKNNPVYEEVLDIKNAAEKSAQLTKQLLAYARKQKITPKIFEINEAIEKTISIMKKALQKNIELIWEPFEEPIYVYMDLSQLDQIITNIVLNARDAIVDKGEIKVKTGKFFPDKDFISLHQEFIPGKYLELKIQDNGCGMDQETKKHLFEPFFTTKEAGKGTGLGLASVYGIVKQNNGFIYVESELGKGTKFSIYLPYIEEKDLKKY